MREIIFEEDERSLALGFEDLREENLKEIKPYELTYSLF